MKTQRIKLTALAILLVVTSTNIFAQRGKQYSEQERGFNRPENCQRIPDLTEDQEQKIKTLRVEHLDKMTDFRNKMDELKVKERILMTSDNVDMEEINSVIDQMTSVHNKMMKTSAKHQQDVRSLLTNEQKVYFDSHLEHRHGRVHGDRSGRGHARGDRSESGYGKGY